MSDITRIARPELTGVPRPRYVSRPYTNVVPLTFRNAATMTDQVEAIKEYVWLVLTKHIDTEIAELVKSWDENTAEIIDNVVNSSVVLQDVVVAQLAQDTESVFRQVLNEIFATIMYEKPDDEGVYALYVPDGPDDQITPDPADPGFFR